MQEYDLYINAKKPAIGLYVRKGAGLPDLADKSDWVFDGTAAQDCCLRAWCKVSPRTAMRFETWTDLKIATQEHHRCAVGLALLAGSRLNQRY